MNAAAAPQADAGRAIGFWTATALIVGNTIGIGIFLMPAALAPYGLNALTAWGVTAVGCVFLAIVYAGLARTFPGDEGPYSYMQRAFGPGVAFFAMWCYWVATWVTNTTIAVGVVGYLAVFFPALGASHWLAPATGLALIWFFVLVNMRGIRIAGWIQVLTTVLKLLPQLAIVVLGMWQLIAHPASYLAQVPHNRASFHEVLVASTIALFAMLGIECAAVPAARVRDPARTIPRATLVGTLVLALIYVSISLVPMFLIPQQELAASSAPFADLFKRLVGGASGGWVAACVVVSGLGALNGWTLILGQVTESLARHGSFPAALGKVNARGAPVRAFVLTAAAASGMLLASYNQSVAGAFEFLSEVVTAANLPLYFFCALAVIVLWRRGTLGRPEARLWLWIGAAALASLYCIYAFVGAGAQSLLWATALGAVGIPLHLWSVRRARRSADSRSASPGSALTEQQR